MKRTSLFPTLSINITSPANQPANEQPIIILQECFPTGQPLHSDRGYLVRLVYAPQFQSIANCFPSFHGQSISGWLLDLSLSQVRAATKRASSLPISGLLSIKKNWLSPNSIDSCVPGRLRPCSATLSVDAR